MIGHYIRHCMPGKPRSGRPLQKVHYPSILLPQGRIVTSWCGLNRVQDTQTANGRLELRHRMRCCRLFVLRYRAGKGTWPCIGIRQPINRSWARHRGFYLAKTNGNRSQPLIGSATDSIWPCSRDLSMTLISCHHEAKLICYQGKHVLYQKLVLPREFQPWR